MVTLILWIVRLFTLFLVIVTALPLLSIGTWYVRLCDFPRIQFLGLTLVPITGLLFLVTRSDQRTESIGYAVVLMAIAVWQVSHIIRFTPLWPKELATARDVQSVRDNDSSERLDSLSIAVMNLDYQNPSKGKAVDQLDGLDYDVILLVEFSDDWEQVLREVGESYPYKEGVVRGDGLGLMLWSRLPLKDSETRFIVSDDRPSIHTQVVLRDGSKVRFVGLHPTPPALHNKK